MYLSPEGSAEFLRINSNLPGTETVPIISIIILTDLSSVSQMIFASSVNIFTNFFSLVDFIEEN